MKRLKTLLHAVVFLTAIILPCGAVQAQFVQITSGTPQQLHTDETSIDNIEDRTDWQAYTGAIEEDGGTLWFRQPIRLDWTNPLHANNPLALTVQVRGLYHAYWDGHLVASNHHRGAAASEFSRLMLPVSDIEEGDHWLYFRIEGVGLKAGDSVRLGVFPTDLSSDFFGVHFTVIIVFLVSTSSLIASAYFLYVGAQGTRRWTCRVAAVTTFLAGSLMYLDRARFLTPYPYSWQPAIEAAMAAMTVSFMVGLAAYAALRLKLAKPAFWALGAFGAIVTALPETMPFDTDTRALMLLGFYMLMLCAYAHRTEPRRAALLAGGIGVGMLALLVQPDQKMLFVATVTLLFGIELGVDLHRRKSEAQRLALLSSRLRGDLLRQNIKPHFLMNSLTALMEWIETSPEDAIDYIDGLAEEFRTLSDFSGRNAVSFREELALCEIHLALMSKRLESSITLKTSNIDPDVLVPPAVFHTLIENALSHNDYRGKQVELELCVLKSAQGTVYEFRAPAEGHKPSGLNTGFGTRYVLARLEEFYGKAFRFTSDQIGSFWVSRIELSKG